MKFHMMLLWLVLSAFVNPAAGASALWYNSADKSVFKPQITGNTIEKLRRQGTAIQVDLPLLNQLQVKDILRLPIAGQTYQATMKRIKTHANGSKTWIADIHEGKTSTPLIFTRTKCLDHA